MTETALVKSILLTLGIQPGCRVWRQNTGSLKDARGRWVQFGLKGSADILGILRGGRFLAIECKVGRGELSPAQVAFRAMIEDMGGLYISARSLDDALIPVAAHLNARQRE